MVELNGASRRRARVSATLALVGLLGAARDLEPTVRAASAIETTAKRLLVRSQDQYLKAMKSLGPGDVVVLANGEWRDFEIVFTGQGEANKPVTLTAETPGKVVITGKSNLRIGGAHLVVSGLVFKNGHSPTGEVIAFRRNKDEMAVDSRVTEVVIDHFNQPDRYRTDYWVALDGRRNRFDHNHLVGKSNEGVTLAVRLDNEISRENGHRIDHNYFGPRPVLGSNGGETIRVGVSTHSMFDSKTVIEDNVFDRCDGEVEIISIKSGGNVVRGNLFLESRGAVVLRHGDGNLIERNVFRGNGKDHTGGIRVINRNQVVHGNYLEGLMGTGFSSALTIMNGVPNSPLNRYVQVSNALVENNSIIHSARVTLAAGADAERSASPINSRFENNLLLFQSAERPVVSEGDISGIAFARNVVMSERRVPALAGASQGSMGTARGANGLLYPTDPAMAAVGAPHDLKVLSLDEVGASYYKKPARDGKASLQGKSIPVAPGEATLDAAFARAESGDTLILSGGRYVVDRTLSVDKALILQGTGTARPVISFTRSSLFEIAEGGHLQLKGLDIVGDDAPDVVGNAVIRTTRPILNNFVIGLEDVSVRNLTVNRGFDFIALGKGSMADRLRIANSRFENISGRVVAADSENDNYGRYNAEYLSVTKSTFDGIGGSIVSLYRGGTDESTFGPHFLFKDNTVVGSGQKVMTGESASLSLLGVQDVLIEGNRFETSAPIRIVQTTGVPDSSIINNAFRGTAPPVLSESQAKVPPRVTMTGNTFEEKRQ
jgi:poly(beta-D-mannuronate) lyase